MKHICILIYDNLKHSITNKKSLIFLVLYLGVFFLIASFFLKIQKEIYDQMAIQGISDTMQRGMTQFVTNILRTQNNELLDYLINTPFINFIIFLVTIFGTPILIVIIKYDIFAQDIYDGSIRFLLFRTTRFKIFISKLISSIIEISIITFIAFISIIVWAKIQINGFDILKSIYSGTNLWVISQVFLTIFISLCCLTSIIVKKPFSSLLVACIIILGFLILPIWFDWVSPFNVYYLRGIFYSPGSKKFVFSVFSYLVFTLGFLVSSFVVFNNKDL